MSMDSNLGKEPCDCLISCGDDPWLTLCKAAPCEAKRKADLVVWPIIDKPVAEQQRDVLLSAMKELRKMKPGIIMLSVINRALDAVGEST